MKIDAHQHFWNLSHYDASWMTGPFARLRRHMLPADLFKHIRECGVDATIWVQAQHDEVDNKWLLEELCPEVDWIVGVVGWLDQTKPDFEEKLLELKQYDKFCGLRHVVQDEPDDDWIIREDVLASLAVMQEHKVPYDLLFYVKHLHHAATLGDRFPELPMVIDHLSKPRIGAGSIDDWLPNLRAAARHPNIYCKLSGMVTEAEWDDWRPRDLKPYVQHALDAFGPERCMFGSDWPVCELAASYRQVHDALEFCLEGLSETELADIWGGTAKRFYGL